MRFLTPYTPGLLLATLTGLAAACGQSSGADPGATDPNANTAETTNGAIGGSNVAAVYAACPPEATTRDASGQPRNSSGQIRQCWPGEAKCFCDADNDCYAESGYVACTASTTDAGTTSSTSTTTTTTTGTRVTSVSYTASPTPGVLNRATTIRATSTGSSSPRYRFWAVTPAGVWTKPCGDYSSTASCTFTPTVTGTWKLAVSARDANSTAQYDATTNEQPYTVSTASTTTDAGTTSPTPTPTPTTDAGTTTPTPTPTADAGTTSPTPTPTADAGTTTPTPTPTGGTLRAFPGAEGFGASATGGRGGRVVYVTNLNASGPGSLQAALEQTGPRYVLFKVSGVINSDVRLANGDVTIAGQTSPGGVTVRGFHTTEEPYCDQQCGRLANKPQNWILRNIRTRPANGSFPDGLRLRQTANAIVDHVSIGNAEDEAVEISFSHDLTIQNTLLAETIGDHSTYGGMLINYSDPANGAQLDHLSIHHNTWNRLDGRMPELSRESPGAGRTTMQLELSNNLMWDPGYFIDVNNFTVSGGSEGSPIYYALNFVGNYAFARTGHRYAMIGMTGGAQSGTSTYFNDNRMNLYPTRTDYAFLYGNNDYPSATPPSAPSYARSSRHAYPAVTYTPSSSLMNYMVANVGAFPRDAMDRRLMNPVASGAIVNTARNVNPANDALSVVSGVAAAPLDTDSDGMPDAWETANGLNPSVQDHNGTGLSVAKTGVAGYTNLEVYLNQLAEQRVRGG